MDIKAINCAFLHEKHADIICNILLISLMRLPRARRLRSFKGKEVKPVTYAIYSNIMVLNYFEYLYLIIIANLGFYNGILRYFWL